jgi:glutaredoxin
MAAASQRFQVLAVLALLLIATVGSAAAQAPQVYRYVDPDGHVVYTDKPPPANAKNPQTKRIGNNTIETDNLTYAEQLAQDRFPVTLYTFDCGVICDTAQGVLNKRGVPHTVVDIRSGDGAEKLKRLTGGIDAPVLQVGEQYTTGFNESKWQAMISDAGYPKTPSPRRIPAGQAATAPAEASAVANPAAPATAYPK